MNDIPLDNLTDRELLIRVVTLLERCIVDTKQNAEDIGILKRWGARITGGMVAAIGLSNDPTGTVNEVVLRMLGGGGGGG